MMSMWASMYGPYARRRASQASRRSGVSAGWNWATCASSVCGPLIWSTASSSWNDEVVGLDRRLGDDLEDVAGDPVLVREPVRRDRRGLAPHPLHQLPRRRAARGPGVVEPVVVALVAVDGRGRRRQAEDVLPVAGGDLVDLGRLGDGVGHGRWHPGSDRLVWRAPDGSRRTRVSPVNIARAPAPVSRRTAPAGRPCARPPDRARGCPPCPRGPPPRARPRRGGGWP